MNNNVFFIAGIIVIVLLLVYVVPEIRLKTYGVFLGKKVYLMDQEIQITNRPLTFYLRLECSLYLSSEEQAYIKKIATYLKSDLSVEKEEYNGYGNIVFRFTFNSAHDAKEALDFLSKYCRR